MPMCPEPELATVDPLGDATYVTLEPELENGCPRFATPHQWINMMDLECTYELMRLQLSDRCVPWLHSVGKVKACFVKEPGIKFWAGLSEARKQGRRRAA
eukprot:3790226-Amphidinium_carterae.1